jgi:hypothetical protein
MGTSVRGWARVFFSVMAAAVFSSLLLAGCESKDDLYNGEEENILVLPAGQAWVVGNSSGSGVIFISDGRVFDVTRESNGKTWKISKEGIYRMEKGNQLGLNFYDPNDSRNGTYTITYVSSERRMTIRTGVSGSILTFTRMSGVSVTIPPPSKGGTLVLGKDTAWVNNDESKPSFIFQSTGKVTVISKIDGVWVVYTEGTYITNGGVIILTMPGQSVLTGTYTVSGNNLEMTIFGGDGTNTFTKKPGIIVATTPPSGEGGALEGDWMLYSSSVTHDGMPNGDPEYYDDQSKEKKGATLTSLGDASKWAFKKIWSDNWVEIPFGSTGVGKWRTDNQTLYVREPRYENGGYVLGDEKNFGKYKISGDRNQVVLTDCNYYTAPNGPTAAGPVNVCYEDTYKRVKIVDVKSSIDGAIYQYDPKLRGDWVLKSNKYTRIHFGTMSFDGDRYVDYSRYPVVEDAKYYTDDNKITWVAYICVENKCATTLMTVLTYSVEGSGNNRTLTITNSNGTRDEWIVEPDDYTGPAKSRQNERLVGGYFE